MSLVSEVMTRDVVTLSPETTIREAMELLSTKHLSGAPVVVGERVAGIVSMTDLLGFLINAPESADIEHAESRADDWDRSDDEIDDSEDIEASLASEEDWEDWSTRSDGSVDDAVPRGGHLIDQHTVDEVMTDQIVSVSPGMSIKAAAAVMRKHSIHRVLVMKHKTLVGILSAFDIVRAVSDRGTADDAAIKVTVHKGEPCVWTSSKQSR